jgi:sec-independent protein translocase protein TatB
MLDIGFFELLVVGVVLIVVMGPERLPEVARQAAFFIRKARQGMYRLRNEMQSEIEGTPFADLEKAKQEMADLKNDLRQFGRELVDSAETKIDVHEAEPVVEMTGAPITADAPEKATKVDSSSN